MTLVCIAMVTIAAFATAVGIVSEGDDASVRALAVALLALGAGFVAFMNALWRNGGHEPPA